ncbi:putative ribonuclease H-like domain-containing protein [Tanacetum coccineum]
MLKYTKKLNEQAKLEKLDYMAKLKESKARFDKWKYSSKNLDKLIHSSMSSRSKFGLGFGETFGSDEVFDLSAPSIFDTTPKDVAEKPLYDMFLKTVGMHVVPPPITGTFMPPSNNPDIDDTQFTYGSKSKNNFETNFVSNDFVSCDNSNKSSDSETTDFPSCVSSVKSLSSKTNEPLASTPSSVDFKTITETADQQPSSTKDNPSFSFNENVKPPRNLCNKSGTNSRSPCKRKSFVSKTCFVCGSKFHLIKDCDFYEKQLELNNKPMWTNVANIPSFVPKAASVPADSRNRQTFVPAGSRNRPTSVPAGRPFSAGWNNNAARPMTRPTSHYFQHFRRPGYYNHLNMDEERWRTAVKPSAGCSWRIQRPNMQWGSKNNGGSHQSTWFNYSMIHKAGPNSGCSRSMTGNKEKLDDFVKIIGVVLCIKNSVEYFMNKSFFTDQECLVLTKEFQLPENSQVVLRILRRHNLYCFNLSDIQPERDVTCLLAKASLRRASVKAINAVSIIFAPLQLFYMDLFGPTPIRSIDHKYYSLVVTDDFSRFTWVFFLGTKDETICGILNRTRDYVYEVVDFVPTKRVNTIHPQSQILGDLTSPVQTRGLVGFKVIGKSEALMYDEKWMSRDADLVWGEIKEEVYVTQYLRITMIGSLMYLTALRPDIMFAVSACSRHQKVDFMECKKQTPLWLYFFPLKSEYVAADNFQAVPPGGSNEDDIPPSSSIPPAGAFAGRSAIPPDV